MSSRSGESKSRNKRKAEAGLDARKPKKLDAIKPIRAIDGSQAQRLSNCVEVVGHDPRQCKCYKVLDKELGVVTSFIACGLAGVMLQDERVHTMH